MKKRTSIFSTVALVAAGLCIAQTNAAAQVLSNRWSFSEPASSLTVTDSVSQVVGTLSGGSASVDGGGTLILGGNSFVSLPGGLITSFTNVTIEAWFTNASSPDNVCLFEFSDGSGTGTFNGGAWNGKYLRMVLHDNGNSRNFLQYPNAGNPGSGGNTDGRLDGAPGLGDRALHLVCVYDPVGGSEAIYTNGVLQSKVTGITAPLSDIPTGASAIGQSPWWAWGDPYMVGTISEFRIWQGAFTYSNVLASYAAGPDSLPGPVPLTIITQPVAPNTPLSPGSSVTLTAEALGSAEPISYQWQAGPVGGPYTNLNNGGLAGATVAGATTSSLTVSGLTIAQNGLAFMVKVSDATPTVVYSQPAVIAVVTAPTVIADTTPLSITNYTTKTAKFSAIFSGASPMALQWQVSTNNGTTYSSLSGATSTNLVLSNLQLSQSGLYRLRASNANGTNYSTAGQLVVIDLAQATFNWLAPVPLAGRSAEQILDGVPGTFVGAAACMNRTVTTTNGNVYTFATDGVAVAFGNGFGPADWFSVFSGDTGNADLNTVLGGLYWDNGYHTITMHNLTVGQRYSVQLFAIDDRNTGESGRLSNYQDPTNSLNSSVTFAMGDNVYILGYFTALATDVVIQQNLLTGGNGMTTAAIVREAPATLPTVSIQPVGGDLQISWTYGTLLQATDLAGPWTTVEAASPFTVTPAANVPQVFYRVLKP